MRQLPVGGWPQGLFGRRDAMVLTLVAAGLTYTEIAALRRGDVRRQGHELAVDSARPWRLGPAGESAEHGPVPVYSRWARVQEILDGFPNARIYLLDEDGVREIDYEEAPQVELTRAFLDAPDRFFRELLA